MPFRRLCFAQERGIRIICGSYEVRSSTAIGVDVLRLIGGWFIRFSCAPGSKAADYANDSNQLAYFLEVA